MTRSVPPSPTFATAPALAALSPDSPPSPTRSPAVAPSRRFLTRWLTGAIIAASLAAAASAAGLRQVLNVNREWRFHLGDAPGAARADFDDGSWQRVGLPHSFSQPYFAAGNSFYVGYGWYRKHLVVPKAWLGQRLFLDFDGAFQEAEIFLNGQPVGHHLGGYTGFEIEITDAVRVGDNLLAVRLNNKWNPRLAPRAGEHTFSGGLYRDVWLVVTDPFT